LLFDGEVLNVELTDVRQVSILNDTMVYFFASADARAGDVDSFLAKHGPLGQERWRSSVDHFGPADFAAWSDGMAERTLVFRMDFAPLDVLFYVDGTYGLDYGKRMREGRAMSEAEFRKLYFGHSYIRVSGERTASMEIMNARFINYLYSLFSNNSVFASPVLKAVTLHPE
tara:strand:- start:2 stop:514 length:513 start_codon:yes stop_codon:yes gene_type:complete